MNSYNASMFRQMTQDTFSYLIQRISRQYEAFVLGDSSQGSRILFASPQFCSLVQRPMEYVLRKSADLAFLYGIDTNGEHCQSLPEAVLQRRRLELGMVLYKGSGSAFVGRVEVSPVTDPPFSHLVIVALTQIADMKNPLLASILVGNRRRPRSRSMRRRRGRTGPHAQSYIPAIDDHVGDGFWESWSRLVIDPSHRFRLTWDWIVFAATVYCGIVDPYNAVFAVRGLSLDVFIGDMIIFVIFLANIFVNFHTLYYDDFGMPERDLRKIAVNYRNSWLLLDLLTAIPYELLFFFSPDPTYIRVVLIVKNLRLIRLLYVPSLWSRYSSYAGIILVVNMTFYVLLAHWFACIWYLVGIYEWHYSYRSHNSGWIFVTLRKATGSSANRPVDDDDPLLDSTNLMFYWSAFYFSLTILTTVGFGNEAANSVPEKIVCSVCMPIFALANAVVLGNVAALIQRIYQRKNTFDSQQSELAKFYSVYYVPKDLRVKVQQYYNMLWAVRRGIQHDQIVSQLPENLKASVLQHVYAGLLALPAFERLPEECRKRLALYINHSFVNLGDYLIRVGDAPRSYWYLAAGKLLCVDPKNPENSLSIDKGSLVGGELTASLYKNGKCTYDVVAKTYCDVHVLKNDDLVYCLSVYPEYALNFSHELKTTLAVDLAKDHRDDKPNEDGKLSLDNEDLKTTLLQAMQDKPPLKQAPPAVEFEGSSNGGRDSSPQPPGTFRRQPTLTHVTSIGVLPRELVGDNVGLMDELELMLSSLHQATDMMLDQVTMAMNELQALKNRQLNSLTDNKR